MKGKKLAVGAALIAVPSLALAAPAAADRQNSDSASSDLPTFTYQGTSLFCNLSGISSYVWDEETDRTIVTGNTEFQGDASTGGDNSARCRSVVVSITVTIHWLDGDDKLHGTSGTADSSSFILTRGEGPGNVGEVNGNHTVQYRCDGPDGVRTCSHQVATSPK
jgi:hypothetical protein